MKPFEYPRRIGKSPQPKGAFEVFFPNTFYGPHHSRDGSFHPGMPALAEGIYHWTEAGTLLSRFEMMCSRVDNGTLTTRHALEVWL